jgi:transposase
VPESDLCGLDVDPGDDHGGGRQATQVVDSWLAYASRSRLAPFVKLARTIRHYRDSIEATLEWKLTNGIAESNNAAIGRIRSAARGFHNPDSFITMIMLNRAGIAPQLPWSATS